MVPHHMGEMDLNYTMAPHLFPFNYTEHKSANHVFFTLRARYTLQVVDDLLATDNFERNVCLESLGNVSFFKQLCNLSNFPIPGPSSNETVEVWWAARNSRSCFQVSSQEAKSSPPKYWEWTKAREPAGTVVRCTGCLLWHMPARQVLFDSARELGLESSKLIMSPCAKLLNVKQYFGLH